MSAFIERLTALSKERGTTRKELCQHLGIGINQIKRWEDSGAIPSQWLLSAIADYFGVSTDYLLGNTDQKEKATNLEEKGRQAEFADLFSRLTPEQQKMLMAQMKGLLSE